MKLAVDLDDVCFEFVDEFIGRFGQPLNQSGGLHSMWSNIPAEVIDYVVAHDEIYLAMPPVKDAAETLREMVGVVEMEYVTARNVSLAKTTVIKLAMHHFPTLPLVMTGSHDAKIEYLRQGNFDFIIDDSPKIVTSVKDTVKFPYLLTKPWNVDLDWNFRVLGWREFHERFL